MEVTVREMTPADYAGKGYVHYAVWQETYRGLVPEPYLDELTLAWCVQAAETYPIPTLVAVEDEKIVGFICYVSQAREFVQRENTSEIAALYVLRAWRGRGIGSRLLDAALSRLPHAKVALFVLHGNTHAMSFYKKKGFCRTSRSISQDTGYGFLKEWEMLLERTNGCF